MMIFIKKIYNNQRTAPFETMFAFFCIYGGIAGLFKFGIVPNIYNKIIGDNILILLSVINLLSGLGIFFGIGLRRGDLEAFGLAILATTLIIRTITFGIVFGLDPVIINNYILNAALVFSCGLRIKTIINNNKFIEVNGPNAKILI